MSRIASANGNSSTISPGIVGHFEDGIQQIALRAFKLEQFPDHGPRNFPGLIGIPQQFAVGIGDHLVAEPCVEKIPGHGSRPLSVAGSDRNPGILTRFLIRMSVALGLYLIYVATHGFEPIDLALFWQSNRTNG